MSPARPQLGRRSASCLPAAVHVAAGGHEPAALRDVPDGAVHVVGPGALAAGHVVDRVDLAVLDVEPVGLDGRDVGARLDRDPVADVGAVDHRAVVHEHVGHEPVVVPGDRIAVAAGQRHLRALLAGGVEALGGGGDLRHRVPHREVLAGPVRLAEVREDDVVEHQPLDRDRRAARVDDVDLHVGDEAVHVRLRHAELDLLGEHLEGRHGDRAVAAVVRLLRARGPGEGAAAGRVLGRRRRSEREAGEQAEERNEARAGHAGQYRCMGTATNPRRDGRTVRAERTRQALADALLALLYEGELQPTAERIAKRAGVSERSLFQHFADREALYQAVAVQQYERSRRPSSRSTLALPLGERIDAFVAQRARLLEEVTPVRRAALLLEPESEVVSGWLQSTRRQKAREVERVFRARARRDRAAAARRRAGRARGGVGVDLLGGAAGAPAAQRRALARGDAGGDRVATRRALTRSRGSPARRSRSARRPSPARGRPRSSRRGRPRTRSAPAATPPSRSSVSA